MEVMGVFRESIFSPGRVSDDTLILEATALELRRQGLQVSLRRAETLQVKEPHPQFIFSMAQGAASLEILGRWQDQGSVVINSVASVWNCRRVRTLELCRAAGVRTPESWTMQTTVSLPEIHKHGLPPTFWVKRADVHATQVGDVVRLQDHGSLPDMLFTFARRGIPQVVLQEHCVGPVIKFYGVGPGRFFDGPDSEATIKHEQIVSLASQAAHAVGLEIFGGDCVICEDGAPILVDLNDWPSFARCRQAAARAIADYLLDRIQRMT